MGNAELKKGQDIYCCFSKDSKGASVNRARLSLHGGSLKFTLTLPFDNFIIKLLLLPTNINLQK